MNGRSIEDLKRLHILNYLKPPSERDPQLEKLPAIPRLATATNGFGLRQQASEAEERKRDADNIAYSVRAKKARTEEEMKDYERTLSQIKLEAEEQIAKSSKEEDSGDENERVENSNALSRGSSQLDFAPIKTEAGVDTSEIAFYQNPDYNFFNFSYDRGLPIFECRETIVEAINQNKIVIIQGATGCGKTTQVPQYILDDYACRGARCRIVVTQPRRIAAISVSQRVSSERNWRWGSVCGYKVSMDKKYSEDTRILYVTTGYLLEYMIANDLELDETYTHIVLDEIHDRDIETDFVLLLMRILFLRNTKIKLVLMSATLDPQMLTEYFEKFATDRHIPLVECKMRTYPVRIRFLDDIEQMLGFKSDLSIEIDKPELQDEQIEILVQLLDYIDKKEVEHLPPGHETIRGFAAQRGAILVFVPGMHEIERVQKYIETSRPNSQLVFCQLHSEIALEQQMLAFQKAHAGQRKIIISTSIAESSITVPDIRFVIDFCLTKQTFTDELTNYTSLELCWAPRSGLKQRQGRAGRVERGCYYALIRRGFHDKLAEFPEPAIFREPLDKVILNAKRVDKTMSPREILSLCLSVPRLDDLERTIVKLKECGALTLFKRVTDSNGRVRNECCMKDGNLTFAGEIMARLPVDTRLGKLIVMGHAFGRLKEAIIIAAGLSVRKLFVSYHLSRLEFYKGKFVFAKGLMCDFECIITAYTLWKRKQAEWSKRLGGGSNDRRNRRELKRLEDDWAEQNMIDIRKMREVEKIINEIEYRLKGSFDIQVEESDLMNDNTLPNSKKVLNEESALDQIYIIKLMCAAAFYPNYFSTIFNEQQETEIIRQLCGKNPKTTIQVRGLPEPLPVFHVRLKQLFKCCGDRLILHYDHNRAYVEFRDFYEVSDQIASGVYFAMFLNRMFREEKLVVPPIAHGTFHYDMLIRFLKNSQAANYESIRTARITMGTQTATEDANLLLEDKNEFKVKLIEMNSMNSFWVQIDEPEYARTLDQIQSTLNSGNYEFRRLNPEDIFPGQLVVSIFLTEESSDFYRAKILRVEHDFVEVIYIDYGNTEQKDYTLIFQMTEELKEIPSQAIQCTFACARPNPFIDLAQQDDKIFEVSVMLHKITNLKARVYSIVDNIVKVTLIDADSPLFEYNVMNKLEYLKLYEPMPETGLSLLKHEERHGTSYINAQQDRHMPRSRNDWINIENLENILAEVRFDDSLPHERWHKLQISSPIQTYLEGLTRVTRSCRINADNMSLNAIILDDNSNLKCSSLLVAYKIDIDTQNRSCKLRETTLFPKIAGIVSLCLLAFAPQVELRICKKKRCYTGALCGLGFDRLEQKPIYLENDIENKFEAVITNNDITDINTIRYQLNMLIGNKKKSLQILGNRQKLRDYQNHLRALCLKVLKEKRDIIEQPIAFDQSHRWNKIPEIYYKPLDALERQMIEMRVKNRLFYEPIRQVDFTKI